MSSAHFVHVRLWCKQLAWLACFCVVVLALRIYPRLRYVIEEQMWFWSLPAHERMRVKSRVNVDQSYMHRMSQRV